MNNQLHIYQRNTEAVDSQRGYQYQILRTLELWIENYQDGLDEEIFCEFEDDIFQRDESNGKLKFRQVKLYASNFSFKSEEIVKSLINFFFLHIKTGYKDFDKEFVFETNTSIAGKYKDNNAELLRQWYENQDNLESDLIEKCKQLTKAIITEYVTSKSEQLKEEYEPKIISESLEQLKSIQDTEWESFVRNIKWSFGETNPQLEFSETIDRINLRLKNLNLNLGDHQIESLFGILYKEASLKATQKIPEERNLNSKILERLIKSSSSDTDRWYWEVKARWNEVEKIDHLILGELFEIIDAGRHCRRNSHLHRHSEFWITLLNFYIKELDLDEYLRNKAVYEYVWLRVLPEENFKQPTGDLLGDETLVKEYLGNLNNFKNPQELEDYQAILNICFTTSLSKKLDIEFAQIIEWNKNLKIEIENRLSVSINPNDICHYYEILGNQALLMSNLEKRKEIPKELVKYYSKVLENIDKADLYHVTTFGERINKYCAFLLKIDSDKFLELINELEAFNEKLDDLISKRDGDFSKAKVQVQRGYSYMQSKDRRLLLKALDYFHKAKDLYYRSETIEGHILALLNISQLYSSMGLNIAAKNYALSGLWILLNGTTEIYFDKLIKGFNMLFYYDFLQGRWLSAIRDFRLFITSRFEFSSDDLNILEEEMLGETFSAFAIILKAIPSIAKDENGLSEQVLKSLGSVGENYIEPAFEIIEEEYPDEKIINLIDRKIDSYPLSDFGNSSEIIFLALGIKWTIEFENNFDNIPIAEEFCSFLQILLAEMALSEFDFHFVKGELRIQLELSKDLQAPEQLSTDAYTWKAFVKHFDSPKPEEINFHAASVSLTLKLILLEFSLLKKEEFEHLFERLLKDFDLPNRSLSGNLYQRMYRFLFKKEEFEFLNGFELANIDSNAFASLPRQNDVLVWRNDISQKYDKKEAIKAIKGRYKNSYNGLYITLSKLTQNVHFHQFVWELRREGWLDWQILSAMLLFVANYKTKQKLKDFKGSEEEYAEELGKKFHDIVYQDEKEFYIEFPLEAFKTEEFRMHLETSPVHILPTLGLENKSRIQNARIVGDFLKVRFNLKKDNTDEDNPLYNIGRI
ncbi:DUF4297 domain-containing protein [Reichenbachiella carrageenanivorans]|uniref:DUF4297 domain-containing protein n=1 Tax=Reichenbachiella carrageenanivorans TaxID=2979869 RepID=A0ABY6D1Q1_9BACT|nr:DUF4297 domain-containing protein [Reichenbachiella carrageenanivorans]UXX79008.1 DUF4297 domain-containing protein [Reichenbachiella carrageenanivorans]